MEAADDAGSAAGDLAQLLHGLEGDPAFPHDLLEEKAFGEGAAEVLPHVARDPLALLERHVGKGEGQIAERPLLTAEAGAIRRHAMPDLREAASSGRAEIPAWISRNPAYSSR